MKRFSKILAVLLILSVVPVSAATYQLVSANYLILLNGSKLAVQPLNYSGTTYLPLRSVSEAVGVPIEWNNANKSVEISTVNIEELKKACTMIIASDGKNYEQGSGVYTDYDEVLTVYHAVYDGKTQVRTTIDKNDQNRMTVVATEASIDIAVLDPTIEKKPVKIGDSDEVKAGDKVVIIGSPKGNVNTVTWTTVKKATDQIVMPIVVDSGTSGSAVFDINGCLIGIVVTVDRTHGVTNATPINAIRSVF